MSSSPEPAAYSRAWTISLTAPGVLFGLAAPWSIAGAQISMSIGALLLVIGLVLRAVRYPRIPATLVIVFAFLLLQALSIPLGIHPARSLDFFPHYSWVLLFPFLFFGLFSDSTARIWTARVLLISGAIAGYYGAVQHVFEGAWVLHEPEPLPGGGFIAVGTLGHHLTYAGVMLPIFFLGIGMCFEKARRALWIVATVGVGLGVIFSFARTAWVGWVAAMLLFGFFRGRKAFFGVSGGLVALIGTGLLFNASLQQRLISILHIGDLPRVRLWLTALHIGRDYPILGAGIGSFGSLFPTYKIPGEYMAHGHPHSDPLNYLVETGILGVLAWIGIWVAYFRDARPAGPRHATAPSPNTGVAVAAAPGTAATSLVPPADPALWAMADALRCGAFALVIAGLGQCYSSDEEVAQVWWCTVALGLAFARLSRVRRPASSGQAFPATEPSRVLP